jgi:hypothetical protein
MAAEHIISAEEKMFGFEQIKSPLAGIMARKFSGMANSKSKQISVGGLACGEVIRGFPLCPSVSFAGTLEILQPRQ